MYNARKRHWIITAICIAFVVVSFALYASIASGESNNVKPQAPVSLIGQWHQTKDINGVLMEATIGVNSIQINMKTRDSSSIYWLGSFVTDKAPASKFKTVSLGDTDAMSMSIFGSQDKTKTFDYDYGDLSFTFSMLGTTTTVHLAKTKK